MHETELLIVGLSLIGVVIILRGLARRSLPVIAALHLLSFVLLMGIFEAISIFALGFKAEFETLLLVLTLTAVYVGATIWFAHLFRRSLGTPGRLIEQVQAIDSRSLIAFLLFKLVITGYLVLRYGSGGFAPLSHWEASGISYNEVVVSTLALYPALGAFWATGVKFAVDRRAALRNWPLLLTWLVSWPWSLIAYGELGSVRRLVLLTLILLLLASWHSVGYRITRAMLLKVAISGGAVLVFFEYFLRIRLNFADAEIGDLLGSGYPSLVTEGILRHFTPPEHVVGALSENLLERLSPFSFLYELTAQQFERFRITGGDILLQSLQNVVPRAMAPDKVTVNADTILSQVYGFPDLDLPAGILAVFQAEMFVAAYVVVPLLMVAVFAFYTRLFSWACSRSPLLSVSAFGLLVLTSSYVEELPDAILADARHLLGLAGLALALHAVRRSVGRRPSARRTMVAARTKTEPVA